MSEPKFKPGDRYMYKHLPTPGPGEVISEGHASRGEYWYLVRTVIGGAINHECEDSMVPIPHITFTEAQFDGIQDALINHFGGDRVIAHRIDGFVHSLRRDHSAQDSK